MNSFDLSNKYSTNELSILWSHIHKFDPSLEKDESKSTFKNFKPLQNLFKESEGKELAFEEKIMKIF